MSDEADIARSSGVGKPRDKDQEAPPERVENPEGSNSGSDSQNPNQDESPEPQTQRYRRRFAPFR